MRKIQIDTNAYSAYRRGDEDILDALAWADRVYVSAIVLGELYVGFKRGNQERRNRTQMRSFLQKPTVRLLHVTEETSEVFAEVKTGLLHKGSPIPLNDVWIAAQCLETGSVLVTLDEHFREVDGLRMWR